jgi:hypothetical protein
MKPSETMSLPAFGEKVATILVQKNGKTPDEAIAMIRAQKDVVIGWYQRECEACVASNAASDVYNRSASTRLSTPTSTMIAASAPERVVGVVPHPIIKAAAEFPRLFGLEGFPADLFRISFAHSFVKEGQIILYLQRFHKERGEWEEFQKTIPSALEAEIADPPSWFPQKSPAR